MQIPKQLQNLSFRFCKLKAKSKVPFEKDWQKEGYEYKDLKLTNHLLRGGNYGVIGGYGNLRILDIDDEELAREIKKLLPTFTIQTGGGGMHFYFLSDYDVNHVLVEEKGELRAKNYQVVAPYCIHPNGNRYEIIDGSEIITLPKEVVEELIKPYLREEQETTLTTQTTQTTQEGKDTTRSAYEFGKVASLIKRGKTKEEIFKEMENYSKWKGSPQGYKEKTYEKIKKRVDEKAEEKARAYGEFGLMSQAEHFHDEKPYFYDLSKNWWFWNEDLFCYEMVDEITLLNGINKEMEIAVIENKNRTEILNALKQVGRKHIPKEMKSSCIQFKNNIYDVETEEEFEATPDYFITNPIPHEIGKSEETPTIDKLFVSWVGEEHKKELYEIVAFCCVPQYFIHRFFFFFGGGSNGKGTFDNLLEKFVGIENTTTSSIERLSSNPRFETTKFYKKLVVFLSEISVDELKKSDTLKRASGGETISGEFKGKTGFDFLNYAKILIPTNKIPKSTDDSDGFFRRVKIIDFPNQFQKEKEVLNQIPEKEFENLARKSLEIAKDLFNKRIFTNDGNFADRRKRYLEKSKLPIENFIENYCDQSDIDNRMTFAEFFVEFNKYLKKIVKIKASKQKISRELKQLGWEIKKTSVKQESGDFFSEMLIFGLNLREEEQTKI